ncbi:MAG: Cache 3/Cache 2 fusion domain-containing protein [Oligoflexia bacterium]|nr:Cache 3/Cache 2 fusion domain-containing protein [Oligoflexia bacterium]
MIRTKTLFFLSFALFFVSATAWSQVDINAKVKKTMEALKSKATKLGDAKLEGEETIAGKKVPGLILGSTKMTKNFGIVDEIKVEHGGTATLFVKSGSEYVRVSTNVQKDDGSRAIGTILDPSGKAIVEINKGAAFYGVVDILGKPYTTGYEPLKDAKGEVIGIYYVGYLKD